MYVYFSETEEIAKKEFSEFVKNISVTSIDETKEYEAKFINEEKREIDIAGFKVKFMIWDIKSIMGMKISGVSFTHDFKIKTQDVGILLNSIRR